MHLQQQDPAFTVEELEEAMQKVMDQYAGGNRNHYQFNEKRKLAMAEEKDKETADPCKSDLRQPICMSDVYL